MKKRQIFAFIILVAVVAVINVAGSFLFTRFDLTSEKRYTLSSTTKEILNDLDDYVYFKVYLDGDFPAGFKKLRRETKEMLDEFRAYSKYIDYEFINPAESGEEAEIMETYKQLYQAGLKPTDLNVQNSDGSSKQMVIWPGALVSYRNNTEIAIELLENQVGQSDDEALNASMQNLEFRLIDAVKKVTRLMKPNIAFVEGHGELGEQDVYDITKSLSQNYNVVRLEIDGKIDALIHRTQDTTRDVSAFPSYDAIIIAKPTQAFDERDKFLIDQYIMHGGKVLWLVEPVFATMDSLQSQESTVGIEQDLNLDDMLFKYGVRLNRDLLLDLTCAALPIRTGQVGGQARLEYFRWYYFPLLQAASDHPMVRNMNAIKADFVSSMDATTSADDIEQIPLLKTSDYTKVSGAPVFITLAMLRQTPDQRMFSAKGKTVAYLLKGTFTSLYANRIPQEIMDDQATDFMETSKPTAMIVVTDGDIIRNQIDIRTRQPLPLGFDQFTQITYANKEFIENCISYLVDGEGLVDIRSRELKVRLLDPTKVSKQRVTWQVVNTLVPIALIVILGFVMSLIRKVKYSRKTKA
ncbi:MAG: gliding motility-associated ABC transporter substrate-binding protein GldG [Bacteroidales bacterium]|nr:gliding motility-associated ABC transporter substrate-binding protein GldG [Bacteroidales bacterium]